MSPHHAVVWLDHSEARIFRLSLSDVEKFCVKSHAPHHHVHRKSGPGGSGKLPLDPEMMHDITQALLNAEEILVVGPGHAKLDWVKYVQKHNPKLAKAIVGIETVDHPTDGQIVSHARRIFKAVDQMLPQR